MRSVGENVSMAERIRRPAAKSTGSPSLTHERVNERYRDIASTMPGRVQVYAHWPSQLAVIFLAVPVEQEYNFGRTFSRPSEEQSPPVETHTPLWREDPTKEES
jgi:hypothetical protein